MRHVKVLYVNDTLRPQALFVRTLSNFLKNLGPADSAEVEVLLADDQRVFIKVWSARVLIGITD